MNIDVLSEVKEEYISLTVQGVYTCDDAQDVIDTAFSMARQENRQAILIDCRELQGSPPTFMERYDLGVCLAKYSRENNSRIRVAIVGKEPMIDPGRFGEMVARNRSGVVTVFTDFDAAIVWVTSGPLD